MTALSPRARLRARRILLGGPAALLLSAPAMLLGACGGSGIDAVDPTTAQNQLVVIANRLDRCVEKVGDARKCTSTDALGGAPTGDGIGEVEIEADRPTRYRLAMRIDDRSTFSIVAAPVGARKRECEPAGTSGCPKTGVW